LPGDPGFNQIDPNNPYVYAEQNITFSDEYITVQGSKVKFATSGATVDQQWGFLSPLLEMQITLKNVPYLPSTEIISALQSPISSTTYLGVAAGFLMFKGGSNHQTRMSDGTFTQDVTYAFWYRPIAPWDAQWDGTNSRWDQVVSLSGNPIIPRSDLSGIIPATYRG